MDKLNTIAISSSPIANGAISPQEGFKFAFNSRADFASVGMFDFQIVEDANLITEVLKDLPDRTRPSSG